MQLADGVTKWGQLWSHAAFIYEDCIGVLKSIYHGEHISSYQNVKPTTVELIQPHPIWV